VQLKAVMVDRHKLLKKMAQAALVAAPTSLTPTPFELPDECKMMDMGGKHGRGEPERNMHIYACVDRTMQPTMVTTPCMSCLFSSAYACTFI
jgi:hypothetical protein